MLIFFILLVTVILYYRYKGRLTPSEIAIKNRREKEYIVSKLQQLSAIKTKNSMLTDLPTFDTF